MSDLKAQIDEVAALVKELQKDGKKDTAEYTEAVEKMKELRSQLAPAKEKKVVLTGEAAYLAERMALIEKLGEKKDAYPHKFPTTMTVKQFVATYKDAMAEGEKLEDKPEAIAGRVHSVRTGKTAFFDIIGNGVPCQVVMAPGVYAGGDDAKFKEVSKMLRRGDIIGINGLPGKSKTGELSIFATSITLLTPCLKMLPTDHYGFKDQEQRYRQRYLDLIVNYQNRRTFETRSTIIRHIREYLDARDFLEVETPMMNTQAGGATARPFITKHNELDLEMYMRVAPELHLKQCIVGGLERVYEIGRNFRNEGIDLTHNPEFTSCEFYWAYADYNDLMVETEEMVSSLVMKLFGSYNVPFSMETKDGKKEEYTIDFKPPFRKIRMIPELEKLTGKKFPAVLESPEANAFLQQLCAEAKIECPPPLTNARLLDKLCDHYLECQCVNPTFIMDHPKVMSPLAKWHRDNENLTERFELFVMRKEVCNAYTELNSPMTQRERFEGQMADKAAGDDEAQPIDEGFITSLEYGLPPTAGWGLGIDRLTMMLTSQMNIKEVLLFPAMKPQEEKDEKKDKDTKESKKDKKERKKAEKAAETAEKKE
eukprot:TRINITY_DN2567_c0_g3_i1.p1 TRINITY_DN2567_c0_g3~~TRINITY_DN2567_c0_g3_i1.p1  ORF type:complete len:595 (+),score=310.79 TRINITY_DN2567_c0_g3_i1:46-1830(+)